MFLGFGFGGFLVLLDVLMIFACGVRGWQFAVAAFAGVFRSWCLAVAREIFVIVSVSVECNVGGPTSCWSKVVCGVT